MTELQLLRMILPSNVKVKRIDPLAHLTEEDKKEIIKDYLKSKR